MVTDEHNLSDFVDFIKKISDERTIVVNFPCINWRFENDNITECFTALYIIENLKGKTPIIIHIPVIKDDMLIKSNTIVFYMTSGRVIELTPEEARLAYTTNENGKKVSAPKNYNFVTLSKFYVTH